LAEIAERPAARDINALLGHERGRRSGFRRWKLAAAAALLLAVGAGAWVLYQSGATRNSIQFVLEPLARGDLNVVVTATGSIQPTNKVDVSSELSGIIRRVLVDYNSPVTVGQVLAELDTDKLTATVESSRAKLNVYRAKVKEIETTVTETSRDYERKKALVESRVSSEREFDVARALHDRALANLASVRADVEAGAADLRLQETNLAKAMIRSPINGLVLVRNVDPGQTVASSLQAPVLFTIAEDLRKMEAQVDVDEADVGQVREGQAAIFSVDAYPDRKFPATLRELRYASETVQGVVTYKAILTVDNSELLLRPGMTATAEILVQQVRDALLAPNAALRFSPPAAQPAADTRSWISRLIPMPRGSRPAAPREEAGAARRLFVVRDGAAVAVPVSIGASDGKRTQILGGDVQAGQAVIVDTATGRR
jgi:HlyD family secretion protein